MQNLDPAPRDEVRPLRLDQRFSSIAKARPGVAFVIAYASTRKPADGCRTGLPLPVVARSEVELYPERPAASRASA